MSEQKQKVFGVVEFHGAVMVGYEKWICNNEATDDAAEWTVSHTLTVVVFFFPP